MTNVQFAHKSDCVHPDQAHLPRREVSDVVGGVKRMLRALGKRFTDGHSDTVDLEVVTEIAGAYRALLDEAVPALRQGGYSDREIGIALGVTQQAVSQRWPREKA
jgi:hypothetical protein